MSALWHDTRWQPGWAWPMVTLATGLGLLAAVFATEIAAAVATWERSTAYNHCWLVLPVATWLAWTRRHRLVGMRPEPMSLAALAALGGGMAWLLAERLGIMEGRQLAALGIVLSFVLAVLGWRISRAMAAPLLYLVFLVPFGAFMVPVLQRVTAWFIVAGLWLLDIPHYADALTIEIPAGVFFVAEACAGLRFIIASLAFGALYALVMFRSPGRRLAVMALALVVPVIANGLRALGIVVLGHYLGSAEAAATDHLIYGWVFFTLVILLLILAGMPFRQDQQHEAAPVHAPVSAPWNGDALGRAAGFALICGVMAPLLALTLDHVNTSSGPPLTPAAAPTPSTRAEVSGAVKPSDGLATACRECLLTRQASHQEAKDTELDASSNLLSGVHVLVAGMGVAIAAPRRTLG